MKDKPYLILVVDDEVDIQRLVQQRFRKKIQTGELNFQFAQNGLEAFEILQNSDDIDMILTDIRMPEMDGLTLLEKLAELDSPLKTVVVSAYGDMRNIRTAMNRGAFDFVTKPIDFKDLDSTITRTLTVVSHLREQQQQLQRTLETLQNLASYDLLTGLYNQHQLLQQVTQSIETKQTQGNDFALLMLDIERYAIIKSGFGHEMSDRLIVEVARRLEIDTNLSIIPARIEANVFAILWLSLTNLDRIQDQVDQLLHLLGAPFQLDEITVSSTVRMGAALSDLPYTQPKAFFQAADTAMQIAKQQKSNNLVVFNIQMQEAAIQRLNLEIELQKAIEAQQLYLHYQPIFRLGTQQIVAFESLIRWRHPTRGQLSPLEFIPLAEETGLIIPLGEWVLLEACRQLEHWRSQFDTASTMSISVNFSGLQLQNPNFLDHIDASLSNSGLTGEALKLEITESVLMDNINQAAELLGQLQERNIQLWVDDFGTGYSSLSYLQKLPINALKIDSSFIKNIEVNQTSFDITSTIISLANQLGLEVVAEGLEKEGHLDILRSLSCQYGQGFVCSRPLDASSATELIRRANGRIW
ncbi:MAG: EAL domain-containing protein [Leptolyngbyaceae cyanobacterium MO_188.B28]|nr:EAL domain-containing protein [Leptolyngbyaceae cyanobacterium MO_188.B28]